MYSYAERLRSVKLYIKYNLCVEATIRELGYPAKKTLYISPRDLVNAEKTRVIDVLRGKYPLIKLLEKLHLPKSSYFYQRMTQAKADKYSDLRVEVTDIFSESRSRYGYRRIHAVIKNKGTVVSEKVIRRIKKEEQLLVPLRKRRAYRSYLGEITPAVDNIVARDFHADAPVFVN